MHLNEPLLREFTHETATTLQALERVDEKRFGWRPHEKSMAYGRLASHIAEIPGWMNPILDMDVFELETGQAAFNAKTSAELLSTFDDGVSQAKAALKAADDEKLLAPWVMKRDGTTIVDMPRIAVIRSWVLNHLIHHRGQLTVYLRLNGAPVPAVYGPSADEAG